MSKVYDRLIIIQKLNESTRDWEDLYHVHASINKSKTDDEYLNAGAIQGKRNLTFEVRYFAGLEDISLNLQCYQILYRGIPYNIKDYDDYMLMHKSVKLLAVSY